MQRAVRKWGCSRAVYDEEWDIVERERKHNEKKVEHILFLFEVRVECVRVHPCMVVVLTCE